MTEEILQAQKTSGPEKLSKKIVHSHPFHLVHPKTETKAILIDHRESRFIFNFPFVPKL